MASNSESGNVTNVANLGVLNAELTALGTVYNPSNPLIKLPALEAKHAAAELKLKAVTDSTTPYKNAVNIRDENYEKMDKLARKIINALQGSGAKPDIVKDARGIVNKITGKRTGPKPEPDPNDPNWDPKSVSQQSFDYRKANFEMLVSLVKGEIKYKPNEDELKVVNLEAYIADLGTMNKAVNDTLSVLNAARRERNKELYLPEFGLSELTSIVKKYVRSVIGIQSPVYKRIAALKFRNYPDSI
jgi:hypothetical protein